MFLFEFVCVIVVSEISIEKYDYSDAGILCMCKVGLSICVLQTLLVLLTVGANVIKA